MIDPQTISEIVSTYTKHGWLLRRVLLSPPLRERLETGAVRFPEGVPLVDANIDAAWFSRPPKPGGVAWEIRYLGDLQYALVETIDENAADFEMLLKQVEQRLMGGIGAKRSA